MPKEAKARIKINTLLQSAGWRFFDDSAGTANIGLEVNVKLTKNDVNEFGEDFEKTKNGFIDFLLLDSEGFPLAVLEAKREERDPLDGFEHLQTFKPNPHKLAKEVVEGEHVTPDGAGDWQPFPPRG